MDGDINALYQEYQIMRLRAATEILDILMGWLEQEAVKTQNSATVTQIAATIVAVLNLSFQQPAPVVVATATEPEDLESPRL
ncbi:hypothetical protein [Propionispora hippei]|uniref:Uncharacterized protein n=1 Tax=Propionispora hippei DSM 15287 TaxID=1123003 RepID=A0A1M6NCI0_9FIRM|nr:hypothetical protein [Propionispora hippei]SHJ93401.1 hypothetical protein SAMN02745170_03733 [Propionispora hippei DSM 15287]